VSCTPRQRRGACPPNVPPRLTVTTATAGADFVVTLCGEIDMATVHQLRRGLQRGEQDGAARIVVDLGRLGFIDSSAAQELLDLRARLGDSGRRLVLLPGPPRVQRVLDLCGLDGAVTFRV
jgi:anti-anti-sigma factor